MINDVQIIDLIVKMDDRGYLTEIARAVGGNEQHCIIHQFGQVYLVGDMTKGSIRAYHKHNELWDWFFICHGSAKFVLKDDRKDSSTFEEMMTIVTGDRSPKLLTIPPGVYHGWISLEDDTQMISIASHTYNHEKPDEIRIPPDSFGNVWEIKGR